MRPAKALLAPLLLLLAMAALRPTAPGAGAATLVGHWTELHPSEGPSPRYSAMVYERDREDVLLFGGGELNNNPYFDDTWVLTGSTWSERDPDHRPPPRLAHAIAHDAERGRTVIFGGYGYLGGSTVLSDTWEWDGADWIEAHPATVPPPRVYAAMAYDEARGRVVLFGGQTTGGRLGDTWEWDGTDWQALDPPVSPPARLAAAMAFDRSRGRVVLFGGTTGAYFDDMWEWDGATWAEIPQAVAPSPRAIPSMTYDESRGALVLFGGQVSYQPLTFAADTWEWNGAEWARTSTASGLGERGYAAMAYMPERSATILFGGLGPSVMGDMWTYDAAYTAYMPLTLRHFGTDGIVKPVAVPDVCDQAPGPASERDDPLVDFSAAHAAIRYFGVADHTAVDQASVGAFADAADAQWPTEAAPQHAFLERYAAPLDAVCAMAATTTRLGPASVELASGVAVVHPGTGDMTLPTGTTAVAVDLRGLPNVPELGAALQAAVAPALHEPVTPGLRRVRHLEGPFSSAIVGVTSLPVTPTGTTELPLLLLTDAHMAPPAAELAGRLRLARRAVIVGRQVGAAVAESEWAPVGDYGLAYRAAELVQGGDAPPAAKFADVDIYQDVPNDASSASVKLDLTTDKPTIDVTARLTTTAEAGTDVDLYLLFDANNDGEFSFPAELLASGQSLAANEVATVSSDLPAGHLQVWVHGYDVKSGAAKGEVSIGVKYGATWPDVVPADIVTNQPRQHLAEAVNAYYGLPTLAPGPRLRPRLTPVGEQRQAAEVGAAQLHASLVTLHGAYRMFYPYFPVVGDRIDERLHETLGAEPADGPVTREFMVNTVRRMAEATNDGHSSILDRAPEPGAYRLGVIYEEVNGEPVVRRAAYDGIGPGDAIVGLNGRPFAERYAEELPRVAAATDGNRFLRTVEQVILLRGATEVEVRDPEGLTHTVTVTNTGTTALGRWYDRPSGWLDDMGAPDLYYLNLDYSQTPNLARLDAVVSETLSAAGLVLDMRGSLNVNAPEAARRFVTEPVMSDVFRWELFDGPGLRSRHEEQTSYEPQLIPNYAGRIALLTGAHASGPAEGFSTMLVGAQRVLVVGSQSAGTNGNIANVELPGAVSASYTGMEVLYPDRGVFHGVGVVPDIEAAPSAIDLRDGIDPEIEAAIEALRR